LEPKGFSKGEVKNGEAGPYRNNAEAAVEAM
jgi:hypothetical protein